MNGISRILTVITAVLALHVAAVWALNAGLRTRPVEVLVPVQLLARLVERPQPAADTRAVPVVPVPAAPPPSPKPTSKPQKIAPRKTIAKTVPKPRSMPVPVPAEVAVPSPLPPAVDATPSPNAATAAGVPDSAPKGDAVAAPAAVAAPKLASAPAPAPPAPPAPVAVELPTSVARYLQNPKPRYPPISHRLGEQGTVQIQVLVSDKGFAKDARIQSSSGFSRLDNAALSSVLSWRFVPGKRGGVAESMWFTVPVKFGLE